MPFITDELFITFYVPLYACPQCHCNLWGNTSHIRAPRSAKVWTGRSLCRQCGATHDWEVNPDIPMEEQAKRSQLHNGEPPHIE